MLTSNELGRFNMFQPKTSPLPPNKSSPSSLLLETSRLPKDQPCFAAPSGRAVAILPCSSFALLLKVFLHSPRSYSSGHAGDGLWQCTEHSNPHLHWLFEQHSE